MRFVGSDVITDNWLIVGVIPGQYRIHRETCMEELGCFSIEGDFSLRPFNVLPQHRSAIGTKFILYTEDSEPREFSPDEAAALHDQLVEDKSLIIITHGWISSRADSLINVSRRVAASFSVSN